MMLLKCKSSLLLIVLKLDDSLSFNFHQRMCLRLLILKVPPEYIGLYRVQTKHRIHLVLFLVLEVAGPANVG